MIHTLNQFCALNNCAYCGLLGGNYLFLFPDKTYKAVSWDEMKETIGGKGNGLEPTSVSLSGNTALPT